VWSDEPAPEPAIVCGRVIARASGDAAPGACRYDKALLVRDCGILEKTCIEDDGTFRFERVDPGVCSLVVLYAGFARFDGPTFDLGPGSTTTLPDVPLAPVPRIRGRVVLPDGRPFEGATVDSESTVCRDSRSWRKRNHSVDCATTDSKGRFELDDVGGPGRLYVEAPGVRAFVVPLPAIGARDALKIVVPAPRSVRGRIVVAGGLPDVRFQIVMRLERSDEELLDLDECESRLVRVGEFPVGSDGTFELPDVAPSDVDLELHLAEANWAIARRRVPAGTSDVDLGDWTLTPDRR
jgi:hypothetical protein